METPQVNPRATRSNTTSSKTSDVSTEVSCRATQRFREAQARSRFTDFVVHVDGSKFPCHRFVLSSCSEFFEALLRCDMRENKEKQATVVGIPPSIFRLVLDAMYGSCTALTEDNMLEVWQASHQLQIEFLVEICANFILKSITVKNFWDIYVTAECLDCVKVMNAVKTYIVQNFFEIANSDEFIQISFDVFLKTLNDVDLPVCTDFVVESILKWTDAAPEHHDQRGDSATERIIEKGESVEVPSFQHRKDLIAELLRTIKLENVSEHCLAVLMTNETVVSSRDAVMEVNKYVAGDYVKGQKTGNRQDDMPELRVALYSPKSEKQAFQFYEAVKRGVCRHCPSRYVSAGEIELWAS